MSTKAVALRAPPSTRAAAAARPMCSTRRTALIWLLPAVAVAVAVTVAAPGLLGPTLVTPAGATPRKAWALRAATAAPRVGAVAEGRLSTPTRRRSPAQPAHS